MRRGKGPCLSEKREQAMQKPVLVIMAAGMGSRYGGLKQIDPVGPGAGRSFWIIRFTTRTGGL